MFAERLRIVGMSDSVEVGIENLCWTVAVVVVVGAVVVVAAVAAVDYLGSLARDFGIVKGWRMC